MIKIIMLLLLLTLLTIPHKETIQKHITNTLKPKKQKNNSLMNKETTGIDRHFFNVNDEFPYLGDYSSEPLQYKRYQINPLPEGKIIDDRDKNLKQLKNIPCLSD